MNEEALNDSYKLFQETGYNGSIEEYSELLSTNADALNDAHKLFVSTGYNGSTQDFSNLVGLKKKDQSQPTESSSETIESVSERTQMDGGSESDTSSEVVSTNIGDAATELFSDVPQEQPRVPKYADEEDGVSRYEQAGSGQLLETIKQTEGRLGKLEAELEQERSNVRISKFGHPVPKDPRKVNALEAEINVNQDLLKEYNENKVVIDAEYSSEMLGLGKDVDAIQSSMQKEQSLEGDFGDFTTRALAKTARLLSPIPLPKTDSEAKQEAKFVVESYTDTQIKDTNDKVDAQQKEFEAKAEELTANMGAEMEAELDALTAEEIDYETYKSNYKTLVDGYNEANKALNEDYQKFIGFANTYKGALQDLSIANHIDDMSMAESSVKSFSNEIINTPRQVAGLVKATTPLLSLVSNTSSGHIPQEVFIEAFSPVTDWLTEASENNNLRIDPEETAANMFGQISGQLVKIIGAAYAAPVAGLTVSAGMSFDDMYQSVKDIEGVSEKDAINMAAIYTPIGTALEYVGAKTGIDAVAKKAIKSKVIDIIKDKGLLKLGTKAAQIELSNSLGKEVLQGASKEFFEEGITEALQGVVQEGIKQSTDLINDENRFEFNGKSFADNLVESFLVGGLVGGVIGSVTTGASGNKGTNFQLYKETLLNPESTLRLSQKIMSDKNLTIQQQKEAINTMNKDKETFESVSGLSLNSNQEKQAAELITRKKSLESAIEGKDKSLTKPIQEQIKSIDESLEAFNAKVVETEVSPEQEKIQEEAEQKVEDDKTEEVQGSEKKETSTHDKGGEKAKTTKEVPVSDVQVQEEVTKTINDDLEVGDTVELDAEVTSNIQDSGDKKERRFSKRARQHAKEEGVDIKQEESDFYTPQKQAEVLGSLDKMNNEELYDSFNDSKAPKSVRVAAGIELWKRKIAKGEDAKEVRDKLKKDGTDMGQAIAMYATLKTATPEGVVMMVMDTVESAGRVIGTRKAKPSVKPSPKLKEQSKKVAKAIREAKFVKTTADLSKLQSNPLAVFTVAWDGTMEVFATTIELTGDVFQAVDNAIKHLKDTDWYKGLSDKGKKTAEGRVKNDLMEEAFSKSKSGKEINKVRKEIGENGTQLDKLRTLAEELIKTQQNYVELGTQVAAGEGVTRKQIIAAEKAAFDAGMKMDKFINDVLPRTWGDLIGTGIQGNLLTPKSLIKNPVYNIGRLLGQVPAEVIGEGIRRFSNIIRDTKAYILGNPKPSERGDVLFSLNAYAYALKHGLPKGLKEAGKKFATGQNAANPNFEYQMSRGFMPARAFKAAISDTRLGDLFGVDKNIMSRDEKGNIKIGDRLKKLAEASPPLAWAELMFRLLPFGDNPFYRLVETKELYLIAEKQGLKGKAFEDFMKFPPQDAVDKASEMSKEAVFQEDSALSEKALQITRNSKAFDNQFLNNLMEAFMRINFPFVKTPINVANQTADFAIPPLSFTKGISKMLTYRKSQNPSDLRKGYEYLGKSVTGAIMIDAAVWLFWNGLVTGALYGSGDNDERKERGLAYSTQPPNTINISGLSRVLSGGDAKWKNGDKAMDYRTWGFLGAVIGMQSNGLAKARRLNAKEMRRDAIGAQSQILSTMITEYGNLPEMLSYFQEQSFLAGTNTILEAMKGDKPSLDRWFEQQFKAASSVVLPNVLSTANKASSEYLVDLRDPTPLEIMGVKTPFTNTFKNIILDRTFQSGELPVRYDLFGNPIKNTPEGANPYVYHFLDPFSTREIQSSKVAKEMYDVFIATEDISHVFSQPNRNFSMDGQNYRMDGEIYNEFVKERQQLLTEEINKLINKKSYIKKSPQEKIEKIKNETKKVLSGSDVKKMKKEVIKKITEK